MGSIIRCIHAQALNIFRVSFSLACRGRVLGVFGERVCTSQFSSQLACLLPVLGGAPCAMSSFLRCFAAAATPTQRALSPRAPLAALCPCADLPDNALPAPPSRCARHKRVGAVQLLDALPHLPERSAMLLQCQLQLLHE